MGLGDVGSPLNIVGGQDTQIAGATVNAQNAAPLGPGVATVGSVLAVPVNAKTTAAFQITVNTLSVALQAYGSIDGVNWILIGGSPLLNQSTGRWQSSIAAAQTGIFTLNCADFAYVRLSTPNSATTGSATIAAEGGAQPAIITAEAPQYNFLRAAASGLAKTGAGVLHSISVAATTAAPTAGLLTIWDNTAASGTPIYSEWVTAGVLAHSIVLDTSFVTGCYIDFGAATNIAVTAALL